MVCVREKMLKGRVGKRRGKQEQGTGKLRRSREAVGRFLTTVYLSKIFWYF